MCFRRFWTPDFFAQNSTILSKKFSTKAKQIFKFQNLPHKFLQHFNHYVLWEILSNLDSPLQFFYQPNRPSISVYAYTYLTIFLSIYLDS